MLIRSLVSPDWLMTTTVSSSVMSWGSSSAGSVIWNFLKHLSILKKG